MEKTPDDLRDRAHAELLQLACARGFTINQLADQLERSWLALSNASDHIVSLPEFLKAVNRGDFDYLLKDSTGHSYS